MDCPRFSSFFPRKERLASDERKQKPVGNYGAHEIFLESEGLLPPTLSARKPSTSRRPSTSLGKFALSRASGFNPHDAAESLDSSSRYSISTSETPRKSSLGQSRSNIESGLSTLRLLPNTKVGISSFGRAVGWHSAENIERQQKIREHTLTGLSKSSWLRKRFGSACWARVNARPPPCPILAHQESPSQSTHNTAPVPDIGIIPGLGYDQAGQRPDQSSGAAARAAVAAQNELLESMRNVRLADAEVSHDTESGIGIEFADASSHLTVPIVRQDPIKMLPSEIMAQILSYLDAVSLQNAELVTHDWHQIASSHPVWRQIFLAESLSSNQRAVSSEAEPRCPNLKSSRDWKRMWRARKALHQRWADGHAAAIYLEGHTDSVYCVQFDRDKILTGSRDRTVRIWNARTYECVKVLGVPARADPAVKPPLPTESSDRGQKPFARVFPCHGNAAIQPDMISLYHSGSILCLQYDHQIVVTGSSDCTLMIWEIKTNYSPIRRLRHHTAGVLDVCFDTKHIVSCSKDTTICLWDRQTGDFLRRLSGHNGPVNAVQLRSNLVVSASGDGIAKLWNLTSGLCIKEFPSKKRGMACVEFSLDARTIFAGGNDQVIYQFDTNTGELVRQLKGHGNLVRSLHLDGNSGRLVSGSYDLSVRAYNLRNGEPIVNFVNWTSSWILSAKADHRRIVATSQDSRAVIIDFGYQLSGIETLDY